MSFRTVFISESTSDGFNTVLDFTFFSAWSGARGWTHDLRFHPAFGGIGVEGLPGQEGGHLARIAPNHAESRRITLNPQKFL